MSGAAALGRGYSALGEGRWRDARAAFDAALAETETGEARFGLAAALWWLGENQACVEQCTQAYTLFRRCGDSEEAARCAVWLAITFKSNFANFAAANGWLGRAERLLAPLDLGPAHGWLWVARAYRMTDLDTAEDLTGRALDVAQTAGDIDLQLVALAQLGHIRVGKGDAQGGFALLDEAMAAALAGERSTLDTVVYTCCDMLNACELADDLERAAQWCKVADNFVATYGCPFLYAECRIYYGSVLTAKGRWEDAERELAVGCRITHGACPGLHAKALTRLAVLRIRQGRLEEADELLDQLGEGADAEADEALAVAALLLARGDAPAATRRLEHRLQQLEGHRSWLAGALDLLVDAQLANGDLRRAQATAARLRQLASTAGGERWAATAAAADGRVAMALGDDRAVELLEAARLGWVGLELPFELARTRAELARLLAETQPDVAVDHARRALATFEELGAALDADRMAALLRSLGVRARTGARGLGSLSAREREVLPLLGAGLSNPEIAGRLHISRKTASHHVSSILTKLGLRNRAEAAAFAAGHRGVVRDPE
ncbi:MAG: LuxR C-terminal-related transcriptional regulator [Actinomycetota bacterium]|jgi:DNA-binding CsgD family transcriptional regulator